MTLVKIINGTYGHRPEKSNYVIPVSVGDPAISVDDDEAKRLVEIGVAAYADAEAVATASEGGSDASPIEYTPGDKDGESGDSDPAEITDNPDPESLKGWKVDELKRLASDMGIDTTGIKKKGDLIQAITEATATADAPALDVEDVIK